MSSGKQVGEPLVGHDDSVNSVAYSPDGTRIVSGSNDRTIRIWDVPNEDLIHTLVPFFLFGVNSYKSSRKSMSQFQFKKPLDNAGWLRGPQQELLFWVPPSHRKALYRSNTISIFGKDVTQIDFTRFEHGTAWESCRSS